MFDLGYILKVLIELAKPQRIPGSALIKGVDSYLEEQLPKGRKRRLTPELLKMVSQFLWSALPHAQRDESTYRLLRLSFDIPLSDLENIRNFLS